MGHFKTDKNREGIKVKFVEYSEKKRIYCSLYMMEYAENDYEPNFDLIIGTQTM